MRSQGVTALCVGGVLPGPPLRTSPPHHHHTQPTVTAVCCGKYLDQWHLYTSGVFDESTHCAEPLDHSVLVVGYGADDDGTQFWTIKNSWGAEWGEAGFMRLKRNVSDPAGQNGLATIPGYAYKTHDNPAAAAALIGRRGAGAKGGAASAVLSLLGGWLPKALQ